jgi:hypothetical protein
MAVTVHTVFWDLDKTYLRTEFDTVRDLLRTAFERADEKRTHPGAMTLMREMRAKGARINILSGSPEQMRGRLESKLRLDGVEWDSFTLKPNLRNLLRFRFKALRGQLNYKLPALLDARSRVGVPEDEALPRETLIGDDAEADAFIYSVYADVLAGRVSEDLLRKVLSSEDSYEDVIERATQAARKVTKGDVVERILIHLEGQTAPEHFKAYGPRIVPFYNYLQAAVIAFEDGRVNATAVMRVGQELIQRHRFSGDQLARSYRELARRGHVQGREFEALREAANTIHQEAESRGGAQALLEFVGKIESCALDAEKARAPFVDFPVPDYARLALAHNARRHT